MIPFWPVSRILVRSGALLSIEYIDPDPSGQCQGKRGATSTIGIDIPVKERSIFGPKSTISGAKDARITPAKSKEKRRRTQRHQQMAKRPAQRTSGTARIGYACLRPSSTP